MPAMDYFHSNRTNTVFLTIRELYAHGIWWLFHLPPSSYTKQNIEYPCNFFITLIHVSETYNTIMSLHVLGISVYVHIELFDNSLLKKVVKLYFELKYF